MKARNMADRAVAYADRAIQADGQNFACHKWMGIILSWSSEFQGTRRKIERSFDIRDHFMVSVEVCEEILKCVDRGLVMCEGVISNHVTCYLLFAESH